MDSEAGGIDMLQAKSSKGKKGKGSV